MNNTVLKNVINIAYVLIYIGANPNIFAGNAIVLLFFFFYGLTIAIESKQRFDAIILIPILVFALINFISVLKWGGLSTEFLYNPQIQISAVSGTKRSIFRQKNKTKRSKKGCTQHL